MPQRQSSICSKPLNRSARENIARTGFSGRWARDLYNTYILQAKAHTLLQFLEDDKPLSRPP
jgi:hypothetical protein